MNYISYEQCLRNNARDKTLEYLRFVHNKGQCQIKKGNLLHSWVRGQFHILHCGLTNVKIV